MDDLSILTFYKLCSDCNLPGLIESFGDLSDNTNIEMNFAYYRGITSPLPPGSADCYHFDVERRGVGEPNDCYHFDVERRGVGEPLGSPCRLPLLQWLLKLDPTIHHDTIVDDYMADERFPNDALHLACVAGHYNVAKWLFQHGGYIPLTPCSTKGEQDEPH